ncbi:uncharacterized protein LOC119683072 [Teleopsis dalmanni]|uniref:uncharacterized protein LOC119683072 n=1 Tax=Teleopsis dalmanni TaxID=139649 RepID=UPI0018CCF403|nr:uncharacterized protein LOC119683072 [Teleopsis dalmanni]
MVAKKLVKKRLKTHKKWTYDEINIILNYIKENPKLEDPTAQVYYKDLIAKTGINTTWDLIRWKVRHLKAKYKKANDWRNTIGADLLESDAEATSIEGKVLQICPFYNQLTEILCKTSDEQQITSVVDTESRLDPLKTSLSNDGCVEQTAYFIEVVCDNVNIKEEVIESQNAISTEGAPIDLAEPSSSTTTSKNNDLPKKTFVDRSSSADLADLQAERMAICKLKLAWRKEKHQQQLLLSERKMKLKEQKLRADIDFKKRKLELKALKIETEEKLKMFKIEKDERIAKFEIELAYKYKTK